MPWSTLHGVRRRGVERRRVAVACDGRRFDFCLTTGTGSAAAGGSPVRIAFASSSTRAAARACRSSTALTAAPTASKRLPKLTARQTACRARGAVAESSPCARSAKRFRPTFRRRSRGRAFADASPPCDRRRSRWSNLAPLNASMRLREPLGACADRRPVDPEAVEVSCRDRTLLHAGNRRVGQHHLVDELAVGAHPRRL